MGIKDIQNTTSSIVNFQPLKWLITGGCGFIGTALIKALLEEGEHKICVVDNLSVGNFVDLAEVCDFEEVEPGEHFSLNGLVGVVVADILDEDLALKLTKEADVVVHLAANTGVSPSVEDPRKDCVTNVIGTLNYLEGARINNVKRFIFASSGAPIGECEPPIHEEKVPHPVSPYGASKLAGEGYCSAYFKTYGVETVVLRFGNVYGPGSAHKNSAVAKFLKQTLDGETIEIYGDGAQTRDFIYNEDLVHAIKLASVKNYIGGEIFQIATNRETTVIELVELMSNIILKRNFPFVPIRYAEKRQGDVMRNFSDTTKARIRLGWECNVNLQDGLDRTLTYFLNRK